MTAQQNSTLIYDNMEECPSLLPLPEELSRYSPILPLKQQNNANHKTNQHKEMPNKYNKYATITNKDEMFAKHHNHHAHPHPQHLQHQHQQQNGCQRYASRGKPQCYAASSCSGYSGRSRTISLCGVNSTAEQGHKEIPIWVGEEPRYVSGVTSRTTCNDIIKALIDDEIRNGNQDYCCADGQQQQRTTIKYGAASRDCSDYVITESWRGIERSYDGNMAILPVWKAWSRVHNELRLSMKHCKDVPEPTPATARSQPSVHWLQTFRKFLTKLFKLHHKTNKQIMPKPSDPAMQRKNKLIAIKLEEETNDEILYVLLPDKMYEHAEADTNQQEQQQQQQEQMPQQSKEQRQEQQSPRQQRQQSTAQLSKTMLLRQKLYSLSETRRSMRQHKSAKRKCKRQPNTNNNTSSIRRRKNVLAAPAPRLPNAIRHQLAQKTSEIDQLYEREHELTQQLSAKCRLYKLHNELYTASDERRLELSIGQIQRNIETYAEQIVQTENELLELKHEIKQDISIVNTLKRMSCNACEDAAVTQSVAVEDIEKLERQQPQPQEPRQINEQMQFVDNIYEFCDNNASMLV